MEISVASAVPVSVPSTPAVAMGPPPPLSPDRGIFKTPSTIIRPTTGPTPSVQCIPSTNFNTIENSNLISSTSPHLISVTPTSVEAGNSKLEFSSRHTVGKITTNKTHLAPAPSPYPIRQYQFTTTNQAIVNSSSLTRDHTVLPQPPPPPPYPEKPSVNINSPLLVNLLQNEQIHHPQHVNRNKILLESDSQQPSVMKLSNHVGYHNRQTASVSNNYILPSGCSPQQQANIIMKNTGQQAYLSSVKSRTAVMPPTFLDTTSNQIPGNQHKKHLLTTGDPHLDVLSNSFNRPINANVINSAIPPQNSVKAVATENTIHMEKQVFTRVSTSHLNIDNMPQISSAGSAYVQRVLPPPPPYSVAIHNRHNQQLSQTNAAITPAQPQTHLQWDGHTSCTNSTNSLFNSVFPDLTPTLTDLKPDELDELLPSLERDLSGTPPELPDELVNLDESALTPLTQSSLHTVENTASRQGHFLINPLTGELEPYHEDNELESDGFADVFNGMPSPVDNVSDTENHVTEDDLNSIKATVQCNSSSISETSDSDSRGFNHIDEGGYGTSNNSHNKRRASKYKRDSPVDGTQEKIKLRLKLDKVINPSSPSAPSNSLTNTAYKVDVNFVQHQLRKQQELRVPPLHISLRGRHHAYITNRNRSDKYKRESNSKSGNSCAILPDNISKDSNTEINTIGITQLSSKDKRTDELRNEQMDYVHVPVLGSTNIGTIANLHTTQSFVSQNTATSPSYVTSTKHLNKKDKAIKFRSGGILDNSFDCDDNSLVDETNVTSKPACSSNVALPTSEVDSMGAKFKQKLLEESIHYAFKSQQKPDTEQMFTTPTQGASFDHQSRVSTESNSHAVDLDNTNKRYIISNTSQQKFMQFQDLTSSDNIQVMERKSNNSTFLRTPPSPSNLYNHTLLKSSSLPVRNVSTAHTRHPSPILTSPNQHHVAHNRFNDMSVAMELDKVQDYIDDEKFNNIDRVLSMNLSDRKLDIIDRNSYNHIQGQSPLAQQAAEDSGIESMDALSEKSPNQASQSPHTNDISLSMAIQDSFSNKLDNQMDFSMDIESQLAKMEGTTDVTITNLCSTYNSHMQESSQLSYSSAPVLESLDDNFTNSAITFSKVCTNTHNEGNVVDHMDTTFYGDAVKDRGVLSPPMKVHSLREKRKLNDATCPLIAFGKMQSY